jgi:uncharacterized membrane protein
MPQTRRQRRGFFLRGLVVLLPAVLTIFVFTTSWNFVERNVTGPINGAIYGFLEGNGLGWTVLEGMEISPYAREYLDVDALPPELVDNITQLGGFGHDTFRVALAAWRDEHEGFFRDLDALAINREKLRTAVVAEVHPAVGIVLSGLLVLTLGYFASGFLGRGAIAAVDRAMHKIPLVRRVYPYTKQLVEFFLAENELEFDTVVAAPYPSDDVWALGFITGAGLKSLHEALGGQFVSVFIPTSPMPMTGFTVFIELSRLVPLDITVDEALRITVSAGVLVPHAQRVAALERELESRKAA